MKGFWLDSQFGPRRNGWRGIHLFPLRIFSASLIETATRFY